MSSVTQIRRVFQTLYRNEELSPENQVRRRLLSETHLDALENTIEDTVCNDQGNPEQLTRNTYVENRLTETATTDLLNEFTEIQKFEYNDAGLLITKTLCFADGSEVITQYQYDDKQRMIGRTETDPEEATQQKRVYLYEGDHLTRVTEIDESGTVLETISYKFDSSGNNIEAETIGAEEEGTIKTEYDDQGRVVAQRTYSLNNKLTARNLREYEGNLVRETSETIQGTTITETTFDEAGREQSRKRMTAEGQIIEQLTFTYHSDGRPDRTTGMQYTQAYDVIRFFSLDYEYEAI